MITVILILLAWRIGFGVTGSGTCRCDAVVQGFIRCDDESLWVVIIPKSKPVHGGTTHENSTTMSLYGYDLS
jgi:hypothetical protein